MQGQGQGQGRQDVTVDIAHTFQLGPGTWPLGWSKRWLGMGGRGGRERGADKCKSEWRWMKVVQSRDERKTFSPIKHVYYDGLEEACLFGGDQSARTRNRLQLHRQWCLSLCALSSIFVHSGQMNPWTGTGCSSA